MDSTQSYRDPANTAEQTAGRAREQGGEVAHTATEEGKKVAQDVRRQGQDVAEQAKAEARHITDDVKEQLRGQAQEQSKKVADSLQRLGDQVKALAQGRPEESGPVAGYIEQAADQIQHAAGQMESRGFDGIMQDTRHFARRRPGAFLLAAAAAGFSAGRLFRGGAEARQQSTPTGPVQQTQPGSEPSGSVRNDQEGARR